jgi:hypothetical protein
MPQPRPTGPSTWVCLGFWLAVTFAAAWIGSRFQPGEWYGGLIKPALTPPAWIFGPVWTLLYAMMAIAAWLVGRRHGLAGAIGTLGLFLGQLALNAFWSYLFFGMQRPGLAFLKPCCPLAGHPGYPHSLLGLPPTGRPPAAPLPPLGELRDLSQFSVLAPQPLRQAQHKERKNPWPR